MLRNTLLFAANGLKRMTCSRQLQAACKQPEAKTKNVCHKPPTENACAPPPCSTRNICQPPTVAINGFGRIGKCLLRLSSAKEVDVVAINQPFVDINAIAHSLRYDTVHGMLDSTVYVKDGCLCINGKIVKVFHEKNPENIKWKDLPVDYVIDASGKFTNLKEASKHITAGAKKVVISAPSPDAPMFVKGVNYDKYQKNMTVVSSASCTTNCAAPLVKIVHQKFGVTNCLLTSTHAMTVAQYVHDGLSHRSSVGNIVSSATDAAKAVGQVIPELNGKVDGDLARIPMLDVSLLKLYLNTKENVSAEAVKCEIKKQAECSYKDLISCYEGEKFVSSDFLGSQSSAIVDLNQIQVIDKFVTISAWYDNEMGYSSRVLDLIKHMIDVD